MEISNQLYRDVPLLNNHERYQWRSERRRLRSTSKERFVARKTLPFPNLPFSLRRKGRRIHTWTVRKSNMILALEDLDPKRRPFKEPDSSTANFNQALYSVLQELELDPHLQNHLFLKQSQQTPTKTFSTFRLFCARIRSRFHVWAPTAIASSSSAARPHKQASSKRPKSYHPSSNKSKTLDNASSRKTRI